VPGWFARRGNHRHIRHDVGLSVDQTEQARFIGSAETFRLLRLEMLLGNVNG
jgi:hypothetical protein